LFCEQSGLIDFQRNKANVILKITDKTIWRHELEYYILRLILRKILDLSFKTVFNWITNIDGTSWKDCLAIL